MVAEDNGHWYADVEGAAPGDEYQFVITNGEQRLMRIDPRARVVTNSVGQRRRLRPRRLRLGGRHVRLPAPRRARHLRDPHRLVRRGRGRRRRPRRTRRQARLPRRARHQRRSSSCPSPSSPATTRGATTRRTPSPSRASYGGPDALKDFVKRGPPARHRGHPRRRPQPLRPERPRPVAVRRLERGRQGRDLLLQRRALVDAVGRHPPRLRPRGGARLPATTTPCMWLEEFHLDGLRFDATLYVRTIDGLGTGDLPEGWDAHALHHVDDPRARTPTRSSSPRTSSPTRRSRPRRGRRRLPRPVGRRLRAPCAAGR